MATYKPNELIISNNGINYKLRFNDENICLIELDEDLNEDLNNIQLSCIFIIKEDWTFVKNFIDKNIKNGS